MDSAANMLKAFSNPSFEKTGRSNLEGEESDDNYDDENDDSLTIDDLEILQFYDDLGNVSEHSPCFTHMLKLVIKDGFKQASAIVKVFKKLHQLFHSLKNQQHPTIATDLLEHKKSFKAANVTRWNSQLMMIRSILRIPEDTLNSFDTVHLSVKSSKN